MPSHAAHTAALSGINPVRPLRQTSGPPLSKLQQALLFSAEGPTPKSRTFSCEALNAIQTRRGIPTKEFGTLKVAL